jgi:DNA uptake protein ComE-like DNA-binding protein
VDWYTRSQLGLLLVAAAICLLGLGVREWRAGFPDRAERLERFDQEDPPPALPPIGRAPRREAQGDGVDRGRPSSSQPAASPRAAQIATAPAVGADRARPSAVQPAAVSRPTQIGSPAATAAPRAPEPDPRPLDINRASPDQIARLPGMNSALAQRIVDQRERLGSFDSPEALRRVFGIGPRKLAAIRDLIIVAPATPAAAPATPSPPVHTPSPAGAEAAAARAPSAPAPAERRLGGSRAGKLRTEDEAPAKGEERPSLEVDPAL